MFRSAIGMLRKDQFPAHRAGASYHHPRVSPCINRTPRVVLPFGLNGKLSCRYCSSLLANRNSSCSLQPLGKTITLH
jgi:hypothetical protein